VWAYPGTAEVFWVPPIISETGKVTNFYYNYRLRGGGVVNVIDYDTSKVNRKTEIWSTCGSENRKIFETKIVLNDYVTDPYNLAPVFVLNILPK